MTEGTEEKQENGALLDDDFERRGSVAVVVLAAGASSRFGSAKQGARVEGVSLAERALRAALGSGADVVLLVTGAHAETTLAALDGLGDQLRLQVGVVHNADWATGQASSVRAGVAALGAGVRAAIFMPVDQPFLGGDLLRRLIVAWRAGASIATPSVNGEIRGAPALFDRRYFDELMALEGDRGGRILLQKYAAEVTAIEVPETQLLDVDEPSDLPS